MRPSQGAQAPPPLPSPPPPLTMPARKPCLLQFPRSSIPPAMRFVVVGGGVAGVCCAEELCRLRPDDSVTLVSASRVLKASGAVLLLVVLIPVVQATFQRLPRRDLAAGRQILTIFAAPQLHGQRHGVLHRRSPSPTPLAPLQGVSVVARLSRNLEELALVERRLDELPWPNLTLVQARGRRAGMGVGAWRAWGRA